MLEIHLNVGRDSAATRAIFAVHASILEVVLLVVELIVCTHSS
jgi:hypothetical protein